MREGGIAGVGQFDAEPLGFLKARIERQVCLNGSLLELANCLVGQVGGAEQVGDHLAHLVLVGVKPLQALVEHDAITDRHCQ